MPLLTARAAADYITKVRDTLGTATVRFALATALTGVLLTGACGGGAEDAATPTAAPRTGDAVAAPADATPAAPPAATPTPSVDPDGSSGPAEDGDTPVPSVTATPITQPTAAPSPTPTPVPADITITVDGDCALSPNPASVRQDGVVRFANNAGYLVQVSIFFAHDAAFEGAEVEPGEVSGPIPAPHAGRALLTCEGPELQFTRGTLFVAP